jgi:hypothetical protein
MLQNSKIIDTNHHPNLAMLKTPTQNQISIVDDNYDTILSFGPAYMIFVNK